MKEVIRITTAVIIFNTRYSIINRKKTMKIVLPGTQN